MNRSSFALLVALLIHILFVLLFWVLGTMAPDIKKEVKEKEKKIKISLKEMPKKVKKSGDIKKKVEPSPIAPPMPKGSQLKKIVKKPPVKYKPKAKPKEVKLNPKPKPKKHVNKPKPKPKKPIKKQKPKLKKPPKQHKPKPKIEPLPPTKPYIPLIEKPVEPKEVKKEPKKEKDPMAWMYEDKSDQKVKTKKAKKSEFGVGGTTSQMKKLYGKEWGKLTAGQQNYMIDNLIIMQKITQRVLTRVARINLKTDYNVNVTNVIEFKLHPNGDMSDFRFIKKSNYYVLDNTTKETIEYAYSRYPRPKEVILVRYNVFYNLARH